MITQNVLNEIVTFKDGTSMRFGEMTIEDHLRKVEELDQELESTQELINAIESR